MDRLELARSIVAQLQETMRAPALPFSLEKGEPGLCESKVGGTPYLPADLPWPLDGRGAPLYLLMQVDCAELTALPDFPHTGLLQWFISGDDVYGMDFDDICSGRGHRVLYHETVDPAVTAEAVREKMPEAPEGDYTPLGETPCRIVFGTPEIQPLPGLDAHFGPAFVEKWNLACPEKPIQSVWELCREFNADDFMRGETKEKSVYHQIGGFPYFTQADPREMDAYPALDTLLLQLDSEMDGGEDLVLWGDCGIGNLFISREDLKKRDFSRVGYNWDCC